MAIPWAPEDLRGSGNSGQMEASLGHSRLSREFMDPTAATEWSTVRELLNNKAQQLLIYGMHGTMPGKPVNWQKFAY